MKSWKPEFLIDGKWCGNAIRFATYEEAYRNARMKFMVWTIPTDCRAVQSEDPVNYRLEEDGTLTEVKS
jgi:hypothetical protein